MLPSKHKLNSTEFNLVFKTGKKIHTKSLMVIYLKEQGLFKAAVVASKKHTKTAIVRNYKRRVIFNNLAKIYSDDVKALDDAWMIVILKKEALAVSYKQLEQEIREIQKRI